MAEHGHTVPEIAARIEAPPGRGLLRDAVYGAIDGTVTTFAIVAGVAGAGLSPFVVLALGLANVLADGFSMAAANYSGTKADLDNMRRIRSIEEKHIRHYPDGEKLEVREILSRKGLTGGVLDEATEAITQDRESWIALMMEGEYGLGRRRARGRGAPSRLMVGRLKGFPDFPTPLWGVPRLHRIFSIIFHR